MSPELDLLDQLCGGDLNLSVALQIFNNPPNSSALDRARRAVSMQMRDGLVLLARKIDERDSLVEGPEAKQVLADETAWSDTSRYFLRLTTKALRRSGNLGF
jgi:hypothetical protein